MHIRRYRKPFDLTLEQSCLATFEAILKQSLDKYFSNEDFSSVESYIKRVIPSPCYKFIKEILHFEHQPSSSGGGVTASQYYIYNRTCLANLFGEESTDIVYNHLNAKSLDSLDFSNYKKVVMYVEPSYFDHKEEYRLEPVLHYMTNNVCTMINMINLEMVPCDDEVLKIISKTCHHLEVLCVVNNSCTSAGLISLSGFNPNEVQKYSQVKGLTHQSKTVCKKLKYLKLPLMSWDNSEAAAIVLTTFSNLDEFDMVVDSYAIAIAFLIIYGHNEERYDSITSFLNLKWFECMVVLSPRELGLIVKACPLLESVSLVFSNSARLDRDILAELLPIKKLDELNICKADLGAFKWFISKKGKTITDLTYNFELRDTIISFLSFIAEHCPKLSKLHLKGELMTSEFDNDNRGDLNRVSPYCSLPLKTLMLHVDITNLVMPNFVNDLMWLLTPPQLENVSFKPWYTHVLSDNAVDKLLKSPFFKRAKKFWHNGLITGMANTLKLLEAAPLLEKTNICCKDVECLMLETRLPIVSNNWIIDN
ncbi:uncharacterized protein LOC108670024 [Hyalella azteca]|uniref:Uncharacterized protein LOC108670024 n=1 Tax=Hyalella azteca TaxID=294128 RepID=A0A8B7NH54_HYAAZ|nr:uncharacterized protein LOC108670024 [Hyalella azteca]